jgi:Phosphoglycerate dehydrogenase and related dehydrogenases
MKNPEIDVKVGILGIGQLGQDLARKLQLLEIDVIGFSRGAKSIENIPTFHGENEMDEFLKKSMCWFACFHLPRKLKEF